MELTLRTLQKVSYNNIFTPQSTIRGGVSYNAPGATLEGGDESGTSVAV